MRTYLRYYSSDKSTRFVWFSTEGNTVPVRMMLSVCVTAKDAQKDSAEFEKCSCSVPLVLSSSFWLTKWRTYGRDKPRVWWPHWPEFLRRIHTLRPHETCACGACSGTFINNTVLVFRLGLYFSNRQTLFLLVSHIRYKIITIDIYIVFPSYSSSKFPNKCLTNPPLPSLPFPPSIPSP